MCINCGVYLWEMRENTHKNTRKKTTIKSSFFLCIHHMTCRTYLTIYLKIDLSSDMSCVGFNNVLSLIAQGKICFSDLCLSQMILYANLHD